MTWLEWFMFGACLLVWIRVWLVLWAWNKRHK